jgi:hypothetical protein
VGLRVDPLHATGELTAGYGAHPVQAGPRPAARDRLLPTLGPWTGPRSGDATELGRGQEPVDIP